MSSPSSSSGGGGSMLVPRSSGLAAIHQLMEVDSPLDAKAARPQSVVVIGGGVQGISTAYWLGRSGHSVTVLEKGPAGTLGNAHGYTGAIQSASAFAPLLARPSVYRAYKVRWCPYTDYTHPFLRVGLFDSPVGGSIRLAMTPFLSRPHYLDTSRQLYGFGLWSNWLTQKLLQEFNAKPQGAPIPLVRGAAAVVWSDDSPAYRDIRMDLKNSHFTNDAGARNPGMFEVPPKLKSTDEAPSRFEELDDIQTVKEIPSLKVREFGIGGSYLFRDEFAVDHVAFLERMKKDSQEKFGVKYLYDTEAEKLETGEVTSSSSGQAGRSAMGPITAVQTSRGPMTFDSYVLCAGADSKKIVRNSYFKDILAPIFTFTTKTHTLTFPNVPAPSYSSAAPASASAASSKSSTALLPAGATPPATIILPETHTTITTFPEKVRVLCGETINQLEDMLEGTLEPGQETKRLTPPLVTDPVQLSRLLEDVRGVYPQFTREVVTQNGRTRPAVALHTWSLDNKPILGRYHFALPNLFIQGGHGTLGWSHALAAGKHVADLVSDNPTFIDPTLFAPTRFLAGAVDQPKTPQAK